MASQLLWLTGFAFLSGFIAGVKWMHLKRRLRNIEGFRMLGVEVRIRKEETVEQVASTSPAIKPPDILKLVHPDAQPQLETKKTSEI